MAKRRRILPRRFRNRLITHDAQQIARELTAPGEVGRAVPGLDQTHMRAQAAAPRVVVPDVPPATGRTEIATYFTKVGGNQLLYQAEGWVKLRLVLETAGPVSVGTRDDIVPVLSGKGILLPTNVEIQFPMSKGQRIYISATAVNRVRRIIEPVPYADQILSMIGSLVSLGQGG
jgi:hypothetical protein